MGAGKILAIIGAILGLVSVALSLVLPELLGWYRVEVSAMGTTVGMYITGIGTAEMGAGLGGIQGIAIFELIGGILVILGALLCIIGGAKGSKGAGIIGGIMMILGPLMLVLDLVIGMGDFTELLELGFGLTDVTPFFGSEDILFMGVPMSLSWGLWIGFFMAIAGGVLGLIGGAAI